MARTATSAVALNTAVTGEMSPEEQAQLDQMRQDDSTADVGDQGQQQASAEGEGEQQQPAVPEGQQQQPQRQQMVPHQALHEERERRKQIEAERAELARQNQVLLERTNQLLQRFQPPPQEQPKPAQPGQPTVPELKDDPVGHIIGLVKAVEDRQQQQSQTITEAQQQQQQAMAIAQLQAHAVAMEHEFRQSTPDYDQAIGHMRQAREQQLAFAGHDPMQRQQIILQEALGIAARGLQMGRNPAQMAYEMAAAFGYQKPAPKQEQQQTNSAQQGNGTQQGNGAQQQPQLTPQERLAQVNAGQQQSRSVGNLRGAGPVPLTAQRLLELSDSEFEKMMATEEGRALLGT